jgi:hypothetical protein
VIDKKRLASTWIVLGFALSAVGAIFSMIVFIVHGYLAQGQFRADLQLFAIPLGSLGALWAWWFLSKVAILVSDHDQLFRLAFIGLAIQSVCSFVAYANVLWTSPGLSQYSAALWLQASGLLIAAIGFFLMSRLFSGLGELK